MSENLKDVCAAILAGGMGTRLRSVVADRQKVVAAVAGQPFVFRLLDQLADAGIRRVVLCTGYKSDQVAELVGNIYREMSIHYSPETSPLGTAGALRQALSLFDSDPVLAMNGDSFCEVDLQAFWKFHLERQATASLVVTHRDDTRSSGRVSFEQNGAVTGFIEKGEMTGGGWINAGVYLLGRTVLEGVPEGRAVSIEREIFPAWIGRGLLAFRGPEKFLDIGTPAAYASSQEFFA